jgi:mannose-6-phosphate isomerase-like protein (cupin superfamily)
VGEISAETNNNSVSSTKTAEHYAWGEGCEAWHLVKNSQMSIIQEAMPPGISEVQHYHSRAQQFFYMLAGEAVMEISGKETHICAGEGLHVEPGVPHRIMNQSDKPIQFLVISQPESHGDRTLVSET